MSTRRDTSGKSSHRIVWLAAFLVLALPAAPAAAASTWYVGPGGIDDTAPGRGSSAANPWGTINFAVQHVTDDTPTLIVLNGTYTDPAVNLSRVFATYLTLRAQNPYRAILTNTGGQPVLRSFGGANYTIEGFIVGPTQSVLAVQIGALSNNFTFRNNIFRDSYNNDLLKVNDRTTNVVIEGNVFYNRGENDEDLDINAANNVTVQDNIFFSDYPGSGRPAPTGAVEGNNIVIKNSPCQSDPSFCNNWTKNIIVRRNVFLNWEGPLAAGFIGLGKDGTPAYEAQDVVIENNLMVGNSTTTVEAPVGVVSSKNVTVRNNTVTGDLPSLAYIMALDAGAFQTQSVSIDNNLWADPSGTMENFVLGDAPGLSLIHLERNAYWNGGQPIPPSGQNGQPGGALEPQDDPSPILQNPSLPAVGAVILPRYDTAQQAFLSGQTTIRDEFIRLVNLYAVPPAGSPVIDAANPSYASAEDILGRPRAGQGSGPDIGAFEVQAAPPPNQAPVLDLVGDRTVQAGQTLSFTVSATDTNGDSLVFSASGLPSGAAFTPSTQLFQWTPTLNQAGSYPGVVFGVSDGALSDSETITITVQPAAAFQESAGQVVMETEHFDAKTPRSGKDWTLETSKSGFSGTGYLTATPNTGTAITSSYVTTSPELVFNVQFTTTGTYYVWVRGQGDTGNDDSLHAGLDGTGPASADKMDGFNTTSWVWKRQTMDGVAPTLQILTPGLHTIHLWMREDGLRADKLLLRKSTSSTAPSGTGPAESLRSGSTPPDVTPPLITSVTVSNVTASAATITWTTDEPSTSQVEYGPTTGYGQASLLDTALVTNHSVALTGLTASTLYHFRVLSRDGSNNVASSADATFTTAAPPPPPPPVPFAFQESAGQVVMETEHFDAKTPRSGKDWTLETSKSGFSGTGYLTAAPNTGASINSGYVTTSPELVFNVQFTTTGTYYVWVRGQASVADGADDSLHAGLDGTGPASADRMDGFNSTSWVWKNQTLDGVPSTLVITSTGLHTLHLWMREDGLRADKLLLRKSTSSTAPSGTGPAESLRSGSDTTPPVISSVTVAAFTANTATITWTTDEPSTSQVEYGPTTSYGWLMPVNPTLVTSHSVALTGLSPGVLYHFRVRSADGVGNTATSSDGTFTTAPASAVVIQEANSQVVIEAEHYTSKNPRGAHDWELSADRVGFSGTGYLTAQPNNGTNREADYLSSSPELVYQVQFATPGTYYVWVRGLADTSSDDTLHAGVDGTGPASADKIVGFFISNWVWTRNTIDGIPATVDISSTGPHTIHLWMGEDGLRADKLLLRTDSSSTPPQNAGPSEYSTLPRMMCVGDSITRGSGDPNTFSYRDHLQARLGIGTRAFVGTYQDPSSDPVSDVDHEGIGGNLTADVKARLPAALAAHMPTPNPAGSRVLLHIGTNDMRNDLSESAAVNNIEDIINMINAHDPTIAVHVALVTPIPPPEIDFRITQFNAALKTRLQQLQATKPNLFIVDINSAFKQNPNWGTQYIADGVHPTDLGYQVMAGQWKLSIDSSP